MSSEDSIKFHTPLPGLAIPSNEASGIISDFLVRFRKTTPAQTPSNIPTACVLQGRKYLDVLIPPKLVEKHEILFYVDSTFLLHKTCPSEVLRYLAVREIWEEYDMCLFDKGLEWCIGITHNNHTIISDANGIFGLNPD